MSLETAVINSIEFVRDITLGTNFFFEDIFIPLLKSYKKWLATEAAPPFPHTNICFLFLIFFIKKLLFYLVYLNVLA
jgi:hypothetical protein